MTKSIEDQLRDIEKNIKKEIDGYIPFGILFPDDFINQHSKFNNIDELFETSGFKYDTPEDFDNIDEQKLDEFIKGNTDFGSWENMKQEAGKIYAYNKLKKKNFNVRLDI